MLKSLLAKQYKKFRSNKYIVKFGKLVSAENLWHFNSESVEKGIALGIACSWIPLPFHTMIAVFLAILIDCNIPLVVISIWFANPITMPLMYFSAYKLGEAILGIHVNNLQFHLSMRDMLADLHQIWQPFLLGCLILGIASWFVVYFALHFIWPDMHHKFKSKRKNKVKHKG